MNEITGVHPYADEFPMASEEELEALTDTIATVGLGTPVVVAATIGGVADGRLVDGRNRREACSRAGVDLRVEYRDFDSDDALKEWVIGMNTTGRRESMTVQIAAASTALILGEEKRINGQWKRGSLGQNSDLTESKWKMAFASCGLILDILGRDALREVRDGTSLNSVYERALQKRESERNKLEEAERIAQEEAEAKAFIEENAPELAAQVGGDTISTFAEAQAIWEKRNREEAKRRKEEKRKEQEKAEAELANQQQLARAFGTAVLHFDNYQEPNFRANILKAFNRCQDVLTPTQRSAATPENIRAIAGWITTFANEMEK